MSHQLIPYTTVTENLRAHTDYLLDFGANWGQADRLGWAEVHKLLLDGHGTRSKYLGHSARGIKGCRCDMCKTALTKFNAQHPRRKYIREYNARRRREQKEFEKSLLEDAL